MKLSHKTSFALAAVLMAASSLTHAADSGLTREQVKMDRETFLTTMRWDEQMSQWVLRSGMRPPAGVMSREEVIAMRDKFLSMNRWDEFNSQWIPSKTGPREMSSLSREQVEMETARFLMMYRWDEKNSVWASKLNPGH